MKTLKFKTNINCGSCVQKVTPFLNQLEDVEWIVDTTDENKILTVEGDDISEEKIILQVRQAGYKAAPIKGGIFKKLFK